MKYENIYINETHQLQKRSKESWKKKSAENKGK